MPRSRGTRRTRPSSAPVVAFVALVVAGVAVVTALAVAGSPLAASLLRGSMPSAPMMGEVLSD